MSLNINWLSLAFLPSIWKTELDLQLKPNIHLEVDIHLKLSAIGKHVTTVGWSPMSST